MIIDVPGWVIVVASIVCLYLLIWIFGMGK